MRALPVLALCASLVSAAAAHAGSVNYLEQRRQVFARAGDTDTVDAPDFGPFDAIAMASAENEDTRVRAETRLTSELTQTLISFVARLELEGEDLDPTDDVIDNLGQTADTNNRIVFELTKPQRFHFVVSVTNEGEDFDDQGTSSLTGPDEFFLFSFGGLEETGVLAPGKYTLIDIHDLTKEGQIPITASTDVSLRLELAAIPLPPALWPGLGLLAALGAWAAYQKRATRSGAIPRLQCRA
jgi:hypothetical protein